jgi:hypothetical protein
MWLRIQRGKRISSEPLSRSASCSVLLVALLFASQAARAGDGVSNPGGPFGSTLERVMPTNENLKDLAELRRAAKDSDSQSVPAIRPPPPPTATFTPPPPAPRSSYDATTDTRPPIRLDARAMLRLNDLSLAPWPLSYSPNTPMFESSGSQILGFETRLFDTRMFESEIWLGRSLKSPALEGGWLGHHIELSFKDGVAYKTNFAWEGMNLRLKLWGPVIKGDPGVGLRLRGLQLNGYPVELRARATTDLQDLQFKIDF